MSFTLSNKVIAGVFRKFWRPNVVNGNYRPVDGEMSAEKGIERSMVHLKLRETKILVPRSHVVAKI